MLSHARPTDRPTERALEYATYISFSESYHSRVWWRVKTPRFGRRSDRTCVADPFGKLNTPRPMPPPNTVSHSENQSISAALNRPFPRTPHLLSLNARFWRRYRALTRLVRFQITRSKTHQRSVAFARNNGRATQLYFVLSTLQRKHVVFAKSHLSVF